ncbi:MAG TPA: phytanoyl-CoA dioxygenase family protein [Streptosporangiaceae bacterium]|jgi:ectoine hydroxylase-related dioxygenase (phytanoyl-CoA dioxygenase family)
MATSQVRFYHDHVLVKEGGTRQRTPWHQDQPYYNVDGRGVSAWIPVDPVPEAGCLELVASLRYLSADARHAPRPWATSPPFEGLDAELAAGAAMDHPLFPVVWP